MGNMITCLYLNTAILAQDIANNNASGSEEGLTNRIFGLDWQLLADVAILAVSVFVLFLALSYLLFNPARELLKKRQDKVESDLKDSADSKVQAMALKKEYEGKLSNASAKVDEILSEGRKKALKREDEIVNEAKEEATRILDRANKEVELEKSKVKDEMRKEMVSVASVMAGKIIAGNIDEAKQSKLVDEALNEIGEDTWQN